MGSHFSLKWRAQYCPNWERGHIFQMRNFPKHLMFPNFEVPCLLLVPCHTLGIGPVRVDEKRSLNTASLGVNLGQVEFRPGPAVPEVGQSDALEQGGASLLVAEKPSFLLHGGPHDGEAEVDPHPSGEQGLGESDALQVHKTKVGLVVLQSSDNEIVPERVKLRATVVQHPRQPGVQSLWFHVEAIIFAVLINLLLSDNVAYELVVCIVTASSKHCGVVHLHDSKGMRKREARVR